MNGILLGGSSGTARHETISANTDRHRPSDVSSTHHAGNVFFGVSTEST